MGSFAVNTKLVIAMIDSLGGPKRVNNVLSTLNLKTINVRNLKKMENRAGKTIEEISKQSMSSAANEAYKNEMEAIADQETREARAKMEDLIEDLGVCPLPDASPSLRSIFQEKTVPDVWTDEEEESPQCPARLDNVPVAESSNHTITPVITSRTRAVAPAHRQPTVKRIVKPTSHAKAKLVLRFPCRTRHGMSVAVDTAWHKRGFDSLTSHTFFMSTTKASHQKKVLKTVVGHRVCGVCSWWRRKRPGQRVRPHDCVRNHTGSARAMEATIGCKVCASYIKKEHLLSISKEMGTIPLCRKSRVT